MLVLVTLWLVLADVSNLAQLIFSRLLEPFRTIDSLHINLHHSGAGYGPVIVKPTSLEALEPSLVSPGLRRRSRCRRRRRCGCRRRCGGRGGLASLQKTEGLPSLRILCIQGAKVEDNDSRNLLRCSLFVPLLSLQKVFSPKCPKTSCPAFGFVRARKVPYPGKSNGLPNVRVRRSL